jgi:peptidoglycan hydrolase-like protein with peptidoglycan-binding domain
MTPDTVLPRIPDSITVHLGPPDSNAQNVTLSFADYIKNVASSEIYPTWPESALRANIYAQISFAMNRIYTEYYRSRGYNFDITNTTSRDQNFVFGRDIFDNISEIVDEIFNSYVRRQGTIQPYFTQYCDGVKVTCPGLSQWGTVSLAEQGLTPYEILQYYYGDDIDIVMNVPVGTTGSSAPLIPLRQGILNNDVKTLQIRLNRISSNYPGIPKIYPVDGYFGIETENAVKEFQRIFDLTPDGIVGNATWYAVQRIFSSVKRLNELNSEGLTLSEVSFEFPEVLAVGSSGPGVTTLQYMLSYVANYDRTVPSVDIDGIFGQSTRDAVAAFQQTYGLTVDGVVGEITWNTLLNVYLSLIAALPPVYREGEIVPYPGIFLRQGVENEYVSVLQEYINYIARSYPEINTVSVTGFFGPQTEAAVRELQRILGIEVTGTVGGATWNAITDLYETLYRGSLTSSGQYPGYSPS